ncbi:MAG TPA: hypothetical protein V6C76_17700 [Drouetiella sp.]
MKALKRPVRHLTLVQSADEKAWSDLSVEDFEDLFEMVDDAYVASIDTHVATLECAHTEAEE